MKVLWLASWFPNRTSPYNGDFIERHATATAPFIDCLIILAIVKDDAMKRGTIEIESKRVGNLNQFIVYYGKGKFKVAERLRSLIKYFILQKRVYKKIEQEFGKPDLVHVHVAMRAGLFAKYLKQMKGIPYVITEHWTGYEKNSKPNIYDFGKLFIQLNNIILKGAKLVLPVSNYLGKIINDNFLKINWTVIPNVVNTNIFYPSDRSIKSTLHFVHISSMDYQKNTDSIIEAFSLWKKAGASFKLNCYGRVGNGLAQLVRTHSMQDEIFFHGEVPQPVIAKAMQAADALVLYSRYETFGCVLIEANACGVPVIVSDIPVFRELITENLNGMFVENENPRALAEALSKFVVLKENFDRKKIAEIARSRFNYDIVGKMINQVYKSVLNHST